MTATTELRLPQLADSVTSVKLSVWLKREGDRVQAGEPIVEVETDKTNVEIEAPASGVVRAIHVAAGTDGLETGALLALIADDIDDTDDGVVAPAVASLAPVPDDKTAPPRESAHPVSPATSAAGDAPAPVASPMARRMAAAAGLDLSTIRGTGRGGRIGKADIDKVLAAQRGTSPVAHAPGVPALPAAETSVPAGSDSPYQEHTLTSMRRVTATRLQQAKQTVPHFYLRVECSVGAVLDALARLKTHGADSSPTLTDVVVRASALALRAVPQANSTWADGAVRVYDRVDIAVAVNTPHGLITPIVKEADSKDLGTIASETRTLVTRAREGTLKPDEYVGGTFTVSNLGMYGVESLYAIVNPPQSCILGVGAAVPRPVVVDNAVTVGTIMACTLSADHRVIDGAVGAELLAALRTIIEQPDLMGL
jgi:pyruvate dehydrogenase E2 component (dihydrolipoamide acetyltransferase)